MEENTIIDNETVETGAEVTETVESVEETTTYSQEDLNKRVQSETDKVRTEYSKKVKELEKKIKELTPVEKSEKELELEKRLADVEKREHALKLRDSLSAKGIDSELSAYLKSDVDVDALAAVLDKYASEKIRVGGFKPTNHKSGESLKKDDFKKLSYQQREQLYRDNPDLYRELAGRH